MAPSKPSEAEALDALVDNVLATAKYRHVAPALVRSVGASELASRRSVKEAIKAAKNKLHQMAGAYQIGRTAYAEWLSALRAAPDALAVRAACRQIMAHHASTRERLPVLDDFYRALFRGLPAPSSILDLACGLNPLSIPWMPLAGDARYYACDIYSDQAGFLQAALPLLGVEGMAQTCDLLQGPPAQPADVAFLFKIIPCLEQFDKNIGRRLLMEIQAPVLFVSFPAQSLGGRNKGMTGHYTRHFYELIAGAGWRVEEVVFPTELVFRVLKD
jgi:16S rRNA (guanine(1405)-N(7))-methyltransferase